MIGDIAVIAAVIVASSLSVLALSRRHLAQLQREADRARDELEALLGTGGRTCAQHCDAADPAPEVLRAAARYSNCAIRYENAANTFPVLLTVPKEQRNRYRPFVCCLSQNVQGPQQGGGQEGGTRIMNPYLLWASAMADIALEDRNDPHS